MSAWNGFDFNIHPDLVVAKEKLLALYQAKQGAVVLAGHTGCGKSHLARYVKQMGVGRMITEMALLELIKLSYSLDQPISLAEYRNEKLLVLDDLGVAHVKSESLSWVQQYYWQLLDKREDFMTIVTTNLTLEEFAERLGSRAFSRMGGLMGGPDNFVDLFAVEDYRLKGWR